LRRLRLLVVRLIQTSDKSGALARAHFNFYGMVNRSAKCIRRTQTRGL